MLQTLLSILHIIVCFFLILVVLLQQGKGGGLGAFGGATAQVFGGRGAGNFMTRLTYICAGIFMLTSMSLAYLSSSTDEALQKRAETQAAEKQSKERQHLPPPAAPSEKK